MRRLFAVTALGLLATTASAWELQPFAATYAFNIDNKLTGTATRALEKTGTQQYRYTFAASAPLAQAQEISQFNFDGKKVTSLNYQQDSKIFMTSKRTTVVYDWKNKVAKSNRSKKERSYALTHNALDSLNLEIQIRRDLIDNGKLSSNYWIGDAKSLDRLNFSVIGEEVLQTPLGALNTLKVKRQHDDPTRHTTFWLVKSMDYIPAKVVQNDDGALYTIELRALQQKK